MTSFVSEHVMKTMKWSRTTYETLITGVGGKVTKTKGATTFVLSSVFDNSVQFKINAVIILKVAKALPEWRKSPLREFAKLKLADPFYYEGGRIDLILSAGVLQEIILPQIIKGSLLAQQTHLGWLLSGQSPGGASGVSQCFTSMTMQNQLDTTNDLFLKKFWETEEKVIEHSGLSPEEEECENFYKNTTVVGEDGRYVCRLPFRENASFGSSRHIAVGNLIGLEKRFARDEAFKKRYGEAMSDYFELGHARVVHPVNLESSHYFIPHLAVIKESSLTTKTRVVFNASSPSTNSKSLNDNLLVGPTIQPDLVEKILSFRVFRYVFVCDIVKMYRQINIYQDDWRFQMFVWRVNGKIENCCLTTVTFGTGSAPFTAIRTLLQLALDGQSNFPIGSAILSSKAYVDDIHYGNNTVAGCQEGVRQLVNLLSSASFEFWKFASNCPGVLSGVPVEHQDTAMNHNFLGLKWDSVHDQFLISPFVFVDTPKFTKRIILTNISKIFDPMGWIQPLIVPAKLILQDLWKAELNWDDDVGQEMQERWLVVARSLTDLSTLKFPRWMAPGPSDEWELHRFADASQLAYGAVIYLKSRESVQIVVAKSRVAPVKRVSIPRLELKATLLLAELMQKVLKVFKSEQIRTPFRGWSDSKVVLAWINASPEKWKPYARNRVATIQEVMPAGVWSYVTTTDNPADIVSRGCNLETLSKSES